MNELHRKAVSKKIYHITLLLDMVRTQILLGDDREQLEEAYSLLIDLMERYSQTSVKCEGKDDGE